MKQAIVIHGLTYDYIRKEENYITFSRDKELSQVDLSMLQVQMLQFNKIPHLLAYTHEEMNGKIKLLYRFTDKRMLTHEIRSTPLKLLDYYKLLLKIISVLLDSKMYMLNEENYILHEDFIFIGRDYNDVYLCYLPLNLLENKAGIHAELSALALNLITSVEELTGQGFQGLLEKLRDEHCSLIELKAQLIRCIDAEVGQEISVNTLTDKEPREDTIEDSNKIPNEDPELIVQKEPLDIIDNKSKLNRPEFINKRSFSYCIAILLIGLMLLFFITHPSEGLLYISIGLFVLIVDGLYVSNKLWKPGKGSGYEPAMVGSADTFDPLVSSLLTPEQYYEELPSHTTLLKKSDATVFLNTSMKTHVEQQTSSKPYIEVKSNNSSKRIDLIGERFVFGRDEKATDYRMDSIGASRLHCELIYSDSGWGIKDLGSSNGSYLNKEILVPYKLTPLSDGDQIKLVRNEIVFRSNYVS